MTSGVSASSDVMRPITSLYIVGVALMSSVLVIGSGTTTTSRSMSWNGVSEPLIL